MLVKTQDTRRRRTHVAHILPLPILIWVWGGCPPFYSTPSFSSTSTPSHPRVSNLLQLSQPEHNIQIQNTLYKYKSTGNRLIVMLVKRHST